MNDLRLIVNGHRYGGWKSVRITRSIESLAGSFDLDVSDRWGGQNEPWPIVEEDACQVAIDKDVVIDGFVDRRSLSLSANSRTLSYSGRDRCAALVDCSAVLEKWTFRNASVFDVALKVASPFGISTGIQPGLVLPKPQAEQVVSPGDTGFDVIMAAARPAGVMVVSDKGGIVITRAGTARATPLVEGVNVLAAAVDYDASNRFHRYVVLSQTAGTDNASGGVTRSLGEQTDAGIRRTERALIIRPERGVTADYARRRADWEARIRAAQAETVSIVVLGWRQSNGLLWPVNQLCRVKVPGVGVDGDMLISQVEFTISDSGETTQLRLVRPDAFNPEPQVPVKDPSTGSGSGRWKELDRGAK